MKIIKDIELIRLSQGQIIIPKKKLERKWLSNMNEKEIEDFTSNYLYLFF
jgi:hypothetical protein